MAKRKKRRAQVETRTHYSPRALSDNKERVCLRCGSPFRSLGPGNRLCRGCTTVNKTVQVTRCYMYLHEEE
jgi:predicted amidophosphoribosyltransferase